MVFIHGGGLHEGASSWYPPNYLLEENIVLVVPQYRLDALGKNSIVLLNVKHFVIHSDLWF